MITFLGVVNLGGGNYRAEFESDAASPTFYVYLDGRKAAETRNKMFLFYVAQGDAAVVDVFDDVDDRPGAVFSGRVTLQWRRAAGTDYYRVDEYVAGVWTERGRVREKDLGYYQWTSRFLEDVMAHPFRVVPVGVNGNAGTAVTFDVFMVRNPDPPEVTVTYDDGTHKLTFTEV